MAIDSVAWARNSLVLFVACLVTWSSSPASIHGHTTSLLYGADAAFHESSIIEMSGSPKYMAKFAFDKDCGGKTKCELHVNGTIGTGSVEIWLVPLDVWRDTVKVRGCQEQKAVLSAYRDPFVAIPDFVSVALYANESSRQSPEWFAAIAASQHCGTELAIVLDLEFFNNGSQYGADMNGLLPMYIIFTVLFGLLVGYLCFDRAFSWLALRVTFFPAVTAAGCALGSVILTTNYVAFGYDGIGLVGDGSWVLESAFVLLTCGFLFTAAGWDSKSIKDLPPVTKNVFIGVTCAVALSEVITLIWAQYVFQDWWETDYIYESGPGAALAGLRMMAAVLFGMQMTRTVQVESDARRARLYKIYALIGVLWGVLMASSAWFGYAVNSMKQRVVVESLCLSWTFAAVLPLLALLRPSVITKLWANPAATVALGQDTRTANLSEALISAGNDARRGDTGTKDMQSDGL